MKTTRILLASLCTCLVAGALWSLDAARAEDEAKGPPRKGVWVFDVRVVRVDPAALEATEQATVFEEAASTTVPMGWPQVLALLKERGKTTIYLDQRITALDGERGQGAVLREVPMVVVNTKNDLGTQLRSTIARYGCKFELRADRLHLQYDIEVDWTLGSWPRPAEAPPQFRTSWRGTHPALSDETLVLHAREQVDAVGLESAKPVELYAVVSGRYVVR